MTSLLFVWGVGIGIAGVAGIVRNRRERNTELVFAIVASAVDGETVRGVSKYFVRSAEGRGRGLPVGRRLGKRTVLLSAEEARPMRTVAPWNLANPVLNVPRADQLTLVEQAREVLAEAPLVRPRTPNNMPMRVRVSAAGRLGWVGDGAYRYSPTQRDGRPWPPLPKAWSDLASYVAQAELPWDSAIVNWYDEGASLGWHRDGAELDTTLPIVTISLGDSCSWAVRDWSGGIHRARLDSGDVTLLSGQTRNLEHTVERIIPAPLFSPLQPTRGRVSITLRVAGDPHA